MNLDKIIELIAEQVAREVLEKASEDDPDPKKEEEVALILRTISGLRKQNGNAWLTDA